MRGRVPWSRACDVRRGPGQEGPARAAPTGTAPWRRTRAGWGGLPRDCATTRLRPVPAPWAFLQRLPRSTQGRGAGLVLLRPGAVPSPLPLDQLSVLWSHKQATAVSSRGAASNTLVCSRMEGRGPPLTECTHAPESELRTWPSGTCRWAFPFLRAGFQGVRSRGDSSEATPLPTCRRKLPAGFPGSCLFRADI